MSRLIKTARCPKCGKALLKSETPGYAYQCVECDEDFYGFEAQYDNEIEEESKMLMDLMMNLLAAASPEDKEEAYKNLERVGVDRVTADMMAAEFYK